MFNKEFIISQVNNIRNEIGHEQIAINIVEIIYSEKSNELWIIAEDRPDKSAIIGKGGWVVGKLREKLNIKQIHVESYGDHLSKKYKLELSSKRTKELSDEFEALANLNTVIEEKINKLYSFNIKKYLDENKFSESDKNCLVAYSGGVDSSFSLIVAKKLGFNPISITANPGSIILPNQFKKNIDTLTSKLAIKQVYLETDHSEIIKESLNGKYHPCGRCSNLIEEEIYNYALENDIDLIIFGDMLSTGYQSITKQKNGLYRLNLPASLASTKQELKNLTLDYDLIKFDKFGCPLLHEVHKKYPHYKKFSIQRILRETKSQALEAGEALNLIWSFYSLK